MKKRVLRTTKIEIDTAKPDQDNWIRASVQEVVVDYSTLKVESESVTVNTIFRPMSKVALETVSFKSPITGEDHTLYIADIAVAIKHAMIGWMLNDIPSSFDSENGLVVIDDNAS